MSPRRFSISRARSLSLALLASLLVTGFGVNNEQGSAGDPPSSYTKAMQSSLASRLADAVALATDGDHAIAEIALSQVIADPAFDDLSAAQRHQALSTAAFIAMGLNDLPRAREGFLAATRVDPDADPNDWYRLSQIERQLGNREAAAENLLRVLRGWPELLGNIPERDITQPLYVLTPESPARLELLQRLFDASWTRNDLGASDLWYELAMMRVQRGEPEAARNAIARITGPMEMVKLRADRRFDALVDRNDPRFDIAGAARAYADDLRVKAMLQPERLDILREMTYAMLTVGDNRDVLAVTDAALAVIADGTEASPFDDINEQLWLMNNRAVALRRLGRIDEALAQLEHASRLDEDGHPNVSQVLNLGRFYSSLGRLDDAMKTVAQVEGMTDYGRFVQASVQHRAAQRSGDTVRSSRALAYLRQHRQESEIRFLGALIEADRLDEAAAVMVAMLESPHERAAALIAVQKFRTTEPLAGDAAYKDRWRQVLARREVQDAVQRVGRIEHHDIHSGPGMD